MKGLGGQLSGQIRRIRSRLVRALAYLEATIDFSEDDIPEEDVEGPLRRCLAEVERLLSTADQGIVARLGVRDRHPGKAERRGNLPCSMPCYGPTGR